MFTNFFYLLRKRKVPVTITEWMTLMETLDRGYIHNLDEFYYLARAILVKSESYFDHYDVAFQEYFQGIEGSAEIEDRILEWLKDPLNRLRFLEEGQASFEEMDFIDLLKELEKRMAEQTEQHDGGSHWIGRGGTSPFGHSGFHPAGDHKMKIVRSYQYRDMPARFQALLEKRNTLRRDPVGQDPGVRQTLVDSFSYALNFIRTQFFIRHAGGAIDKGSQFFLAISQLVQFRGRLR